MKTRGQVVVLAALTLLLLALSMAMSFSLANAVRGRIRLQSQADAQAFSLATVEARALNVTVYTNRTIAALTVTNLSVHAWHAVASESVSILQAGTSAMDGVIADELQCCALGRPHGDEKCCQDAEEAREIRATFARTAAQYEQLLIGLEPEFNETVRLLDRASVAVHLRQKQVLDRAWAELADEHRARSVLQLLKARNAPQASYVSLAHELNQREFACAFEGWEHDDDCRTLLGMVPPKSTVPRRSALIEDVSNAARARFEVFCGQAGGCERAGHADFQPSSPFLRGLMHGEGSICFGFVGTSGVTRLDHALPPLNIWPARSVGSKTAGGLAIGWREGRGAGSLGSASFSDAAGGLHSPGHALPHQRFGGIQLFDADDDLDSPTRTFDVCPPERSCFINFRGFDPTREVPRTDGTSAWLGSVDELDRGLPSVWGAVKQDLGLSRTGARGPWELNARGEVKLNLGNGLAPKLTLRPGEALAVSKAKVYFHELGNPWPPSPNMFDPFFRAKLERFRCAELKELLGQLGDVRGHELVDRWESPVDGQPQSMGCPEEAEE